jgi:hypothetical protein
MTSVGLSIITRGLLQLLQAATIAVHACTQFGLGCGQSL